MAGEERKAQRARQNEINRLKREIAKNQKQKGILSLCILVAVLLCFYAYSLGKHVGKTEASKSSGVVIADENSISENGTGNDSQNALAGEDILEEILLVNKNNPLPENYEPELIKMQDGYSYAAKEAYQPLCDMLKAGTKEGLSFKICSSYRDVERQTELFEEDVNALLKQGYSYTEAYFEVSKETMPPGCSEHSTGLAFDIVAEDYQLLDAKQALTEESIWLREHCAEYGFILRYPDGKEDITGISYESWHFRYVGVEAAEYIMENDITLEEYLNQM